LTTQQITLDDWNVIREFAMSAVSLLEEGLDKLAEAEGVPDAERVLAIGAVNEKLDEVMQIIRKIDGGCREIILGKAA
jgi:hypothetical protein